MLNALSRLRGVTRRLVRREDGATAVEFALVAAPFFGLLLGVMELGLVFMGSVTLDNATQKAAREIRTGQIVSVGTAAQQAEAGGKFREKICANMGWMNNGCLENVTVDVRTFNQFRDVSYQNPVTNETFNPGAVQFNTGGSEAIVLVRVYYQWKLYFPLMAGALEKTPGKTLLSSVTTFRNEPYATVTP